MTQSIINYSRLVQATPKIQQLSQIKVCPSLKSESCARQSALGGTPFRRDCAIYEEGLYNLQNLPPPCGNMTNSHSQRLYQSGLMISFVIQFLQNLDEFRRLCVSYTQSAFFGQVLSSALFLCFLVPTPLSLKGWPYH